MYSRTLTVASLVLSTLPHVFGKDFSVLVGGPGVLKYDPQFVQGAVPGDTVTFTFKQSNHTATQSTFENPCELAPDGFDSGFIPVAADNVDGPFPAAQFTVEDTNPVWVYCRQANHCQQGMVFAINPGDQFSAFQTAAMGGNATASSSSPPPPPSTSSAPPPPVTASIPTTTAISTSASAAPSVLPTDHQVVVGGSSFTFSPANISAQIGDTVTFQFMQKNHTATQSSFLQPCLSLTETSTSGQIGFDSGFMPVADGATTFPTFKVRVNDSAPIWVCCQQANHCGQGMVFSVNAVETGPNNFAAFQARAMQLNGTGSGSSSSAAPSATNGAIRFVVSGVSTSLVVPLLAVVLGGFI